MDERADIPRVNESKFLASENLRGEVWRLAWPAILQNLLHTLIFFVDSIMIGHIGEAEGLPEKGVSAMAAMTVASPVVWSISMVFITVISVATVAIVARAYGERDSLRVRLSTAAGIILAAIMGAAVAIAGWLFSGDIVSLFSENKDPAILDQAAGYMEIVFSASIFAGVAMVGMSALRGVGDTRTPLMVAVFSNLVNVVVNYLFIYGKLGLPAMGLAGAALGTALARVAEFMLISIALFSREVRLNLTDRISGGTASREGKPRVSLQWQDFVRVKSEDLKRIFRIGIPAGIEAIILQSGYLLFTRVITGLPPTSMAAHRVAIAIESISFMPAAGFQVAASTVMGQCLGARRPDLAEKGARIANTMAVLFSSAIGILLLFLPEVLVRFFNSDAGVVAIGALCLRIAAIEQPFMAMGMTLSGALKGAGDTKSPMYVAWVGTWLMRVPFVYLTIKYFGMGLEGAWLTMILDWLVRSIVLWLVLRRGRWKEIRI